MEIKSENDIREIRIEKSIIRGLDRAILEFKVQSLSYEKALAEKQHHEKVLRDLRIKYGFEN